LLARLLLTSREEQASEALRENPKGADDLGFRILELALMISQWQEAHRVIPRHARQSGVDLVVMGTVARRGLAGLITGNTAERLLHGLSCSLLAIKPEGFVTPVTLDESLEENLGGAR
jgi:hypothetical protein